MSTAVAVRQEEIRALDAPRPPISLIRPIAQPSEVLRAQEETRELVKAALQEGRDFGKIPGVDKPSLLKPGAERVSLAFGCTTRFTIVEKEVDHDRDVRWLKTKWVEKPKPQNHDELKARGIGRNRKFGNKWVWQEKVDESGASIGLYRYVVLCELVHRESGQVVGACLGSCSSMESKYIDRPRDCENTIIKMAEKRALVGATLTTFGLSEQFTQDVEDLPAEQRGEAATPQAGTDEEEQELPPLTLELALAMPLPGAKTAWNGRGGTPLGQLEPKMLASVRKWVHGKIEEGEAANAEPDSVKLRLRAACDLILEARKGEADRSQTAMDLGGASTATAPAASSGSVEMPPAGTVASALEPNAKASPRKAVGVAELAQSVTKLLEHEKLTSQERADFRKKLEKADAVETLQLLIGELEELIEAPF